MFAVLEAAHRIQDRIEQALESVGLSFAKYGVLDLLVKAGEPLALGELAGRSQCVRSNMTQLIDRLEGEGLVKRTSDPTDRRVVRAEITALGRERAEAGGRRMATLKAEFAASLSTEERNALIRMAAMHG